MSAEEGREWGRKRMRKRKIIQFKTAPSSECEGMNDSCNVQSKLTYIELVTQLLQHHLSGKHKDSLGSDYLCSRRKQNHGLYWFFHSGAAAGPLSVSSTPPVSCLALLSELPARF